MSAAVAPSQTCGCGCGQAVSGRRFLNARHKERFEAPYPRYLSTTERLQKCAKHGEYRQRAHGFQTPNGSGSGVNYGTMFWVGECSTCTQEETARLESLKPKPMSACEARTCNCPAPRCKDCGQPMKMAPGSLGWHRWICTDIASFEDQKDERGMITKPAAVTGTHREETWTGWRDECPK